ncbi:MAG: DUF4157 domain-containing protein [Alphaproteobacteria bacterium]|nr:DUF4157 domain-containing protein [Alphaproteobacteria bacterium]
MAKDTVSRITGRLQRSELQRMSMADGGAVYRGALASRALQAVGARAMTLDRSIIVAEDFNPSRPEDAALYAHERFHEQHGDGEGGGGGDNFRDAEEIAARATEAMVFHRMAGGYEGGHEGGSGPGKFDPHTAQHKGDGVSPQSTSATQSEEAPDNPDVQRGYQALKAQGYTHEDIVHMLARKMLGAIDEKKGAGNDRHADKRGAW